MTTRFATLATLSLMLVLNAGCAAHLAQTAGETLGARVAENVANQLPPPNAKVVTTVKGGDWCGVMEAKGWPRRPTAAELKAMSRKDVEILVSNDEHGEKFCGWKP
jgi:hypothetical protein